MDDILIPNTTTSEPSSGRSNDGPSEMVKVKFTKFVQLVATHDFEDVMKEYGDDDIIVNSNLLTDLASAHEDTEESDNKKMPIMLLAGIVIGIVLTYFLIRY